MILNIKKFIRNFPALKTNDQNFTQVALLIYAETSKSAEKKNCNNKPIYKQKSSFLLNSRQKLQRLNYYYNIKMCVKKIFTKIIRMRLAERL